MCQLNPVLFNSTQKSTIDTNEVKTRLEKSQIVLKRGVNVFLPESENQYNQWTYYLYRGTKGVNFLVFNRIIINPNMPETRKTEDVLLHELAHTYLKQEYGLILAHKMPIWKQEGFCEYISESSTMERKEGMELFLNKSREESLLATNSLKAEQYKYFKSRLVFEYLIEKNGLTPKQILESEINEQSVVNEMRKCFATAKL